MTATCADGPWQIGARVHYGFLWPHRPSSWILVQGHSVATEVFMERQLLGDRAWHHHYRGPSCGVGFMYAGMADPDRIGAVVRLLPYLNLPLVKGERGSFGMQLGWGLGYVSNPFERRDNSKQIAIGSTLNTAIQIMAQYKLQLGRTSLCTGLGIDHWSNGSVALPNLGLNLLSASVGMAYSLGEPEPYEHVMDTTQLDRPRRTYSVVGAFAMSETGRPESGQYSVYSVIGQVQWRLSKKSAISGGVDLFNKGALGTLYPELKEVSRMAYTQAGVHGGYALLFGRGELMLQMGYYVYTPKPEAEKFYHRLGCRYTIGKHLVAHVGLKSHYAVADHWEFGFGYKW
ncbi:MAG: acyloxyacyl hydrolase [Flavobacteriales bacterium]